jgi:hypothetical protein
MAINQSVNKLSVFVPFAQAFVATPFVPANVTGPPQTNAEINESFDLPAGTVNSGNRLEFATVAASASVNLPAALGGSAIMGAPNFKGTFFFDQLGGGSSQSFFAVEGAPNAPTSFASMLNAMKQLATPRSGLSQCIDAAPGCINPLRFRAIRVDDVRSKVMGQTVVNPQLSLQSYRRTLVNLDPDVNLQNDIADGCYKVTFGDALGNHANMYFHGVPIDSQLADFSSAPLPAFESRFPEIEPRWIQALNNFTNQLIALGLGMRYTTVTWTPDGLPINQGVLLIPGTGNGTPIAVEYGKAGTGAQTYTFQLPVGAGNVIGKFRVICREFKQLRILNGRHAAKGWLAGGNYYVNVRMNAPNYLPFDGFGYLANEVFGTFLPSPAPPVSQANFSGVSGAIYTTHKVGRPFGQARGRRSPVVR